MNRFLGPGLLIGVFAVFLIITSFFFTVNERQQALVLRFGEVVRDPTDAGLKFKLPIENVIYLDKRNLEYDHPAREIFTVNQERLVVDAFVRYRIVEAQRYYESFRAASGGDQRSLRQAGERRIEAVLESSLRGVLGEATDLDIIRNRRAQLMQGIRDVMAEEARRFGVEIIDVKIRRADFPQENEDDVFQRMRSERIQIAQRIRAEGDEQARRITAQADRAETEILARAQREALEIQGRADAARNCIFAGAYDGVPVRITVTELDEDNAVIDAAQADADVEAVEEAPVENGGVSINLEAAQAVADPSTQITCEFLPGGQRDPQRAEFFGFQRSLLAYEQALRDGETTILLSPDSEFFRYFNDFQTRN